MSLGDTAESDLLKLLFNNTNWANLGDTVGVRGSSTAGSLFVSLHTGVLTDTSVQTTNEAAYTSYARVAVPRSVTGWTISGSSPTQAANTSATTYPTCTGGSETETYFAVGRDVTGAGEILWYGPLTSPLAVSLGITPSFAINQLVCTID